MMHKILHCCGRRVVVAMMVMFVYFFAPIAFADSVVLMVGTEAKGDGDGRDWQNAATLSSAIDNAEATELRLLAGDYPLAQQLTIADGRALKIVGGYTGDGETIGDAMSVIYRETDAGDMRLLQATGSQIVLENLVFTNGLFATSGQHGLALHLSNCQTKMKNCAVRENRGARLSAIYKGSIYVSGGSFEAEACDISDNLCDIYSYSSEVYGLGLYAYNASVILRDSTINRNRATVQYLPHQGIGVYVESGDLLVTNCTFIGNYCRREENYTRFSELGGALCFSSAKHTCTIADTIFERNWLNANNAPGGCAYIYCRNASLTRCIFKDNGIRPTDDAMAGPAATWDRGDVYLNSVDCVGMTNCVLVGTGTQPALRLAGGKLLAHRVTVAGTKSACGVSVEAGAASFSDSILWDNAEGDVVVKPGVTFESRYCDSEDGLTGYGNMSIDPCLSEDGYGHLLSEAGYYANGGFTGGEWTVATVTSPLIDKGDPGLGVDSETQPNGHLPNIGGYAGTEVASRSKLGDEPLVDPGELKVFAYEVIARTDSGIVRGEVASTGGEAETVEVYVVWDSVDRGTASMSEWAHSSKIGEFAPWTLFDAEATGVSGPTVCRLVAVNGVQTAFSAPALAFEPSRLPTLSATKVSQVLRTTLYVSAAISDNGGADTTLRAKIYPYGGSVEDAIVVQFNNGLAVNEGENYGVPATGLEPGTQYTVLIEAVNNAGVDAEAKTCTTLTVAPHTFYVSPTGGGERDGSDAENALEGLQPALNAATSAGDEIIVTDGSYTTPQAAAGELSYLYVSGAKGLIIRGVTAETTVIERGSEMMRLLHVVDSKIEFRDLTFKGGRMNYAQSYGHGVYGQNSHLKFNRCSFIDNGETEYTSGHYGGAIAIDGCSARFNDCVFAANFIRANTGETADFGAGVWSKNAVLELSGCLFATNFIYAQHYGGQGGALYATGGSVVVTNCIFNGNYVTHDRGYGSAGSRSQLGGAIYFENVPEGRIVDCLFDGNYAHNGTGNRSGGTIYLSGAAGVAEISRCRIVRPGVSPYTANTFFDTGAITLGSGSATIVNSLFVGGHSNSVEAVGGTLAVLNSTIVGNDTLGIGQWGGTLAVTNSIVYGNAAGGILQYGGVADVAYSDIQGDAVYAGEGNLNADPLLYGPTKKRAYHLKHGSPCTGAGDAAGWTAADTDLDGLPRIKNGKVDLGCYSFNAPGLLLLVK